MAITVILPAYNEARIIGKVIDEVKATLPNAQIIVADSHSEDDTAQIAIDKKATVVYCGRGKGVAVRQVLSYINGVFNADYVFMLDADYTYPARYLLPMLDKLEAGKLVPGYDAVYGWRKNKQEGSMSRLHKIGNNGLTVLANILYSPPWIEDLCTGMWGFNKATVELLKKELTSTGFALEADIYSCLAKAQKLITCVEIDYRPRIGEVAKLKYKDAFKIANFLIKRRF